MSATTINSAAFNTLITDIFTEITNSVDRGGRSAMTAALPMGAQKITGMADPTIATDGATKNYVDTTTAAFFSTGDVKLTLKSTPDSGWLLFDDGTFGSASSGSSNSNNAANLALFTLLFNAPFTDANVPILTSGGGATTRAAQVSASAAWAANCRMTLPKTLGRALGVAGSGSGLTARTLGQALGEENHLLTLGETPAGITSANAAQTITINNFAKLVVTDVGALVSQIPTISSGAVNIVATTNTGWTPITSLSQANSISVTSNNTGGAVHNNMQPTSFLNAMVKL